MKKWLIAFVSCAVLAGCGGGSGLDGLNGNGSGSGNGGGNGGQSLPVPNLGSKAQAQVIYLSGQARRGIGSQIAILGHTRIYNSPTDFQPFDLQGTFTPVNVRLDGYTMNQFLFDVPLTVGGPAKTYSQFPLLLDGIDVVTDDQGGTSHLYTTNSPLQLGVFNLNIALYPGRQTTVQVLLNDAILSYDSGTSSVVFSKSEFETENYAPYNGKLNAFLSDFVSFDVSALPANQRPLMQNGQRATMVHFTGDTTGISAGFNTQDSFNILKPVTIDQGMIIPPQNLGGQTAPGQYTVQEPDPQDPFGDRQIVALAGIWRPYTSLLSNVGTFAMVALPTTRSSTTNEVVLFNRNASGTITAMWHGAIDYTSATKGVIRLYSLDTLPDANAQPLADGTVSFTKVGGVVKQGTFSITNAPADFPFPKDGGFVVLR